MDLTGWDRETSPYHEGERTLHERLGRAEYQERMGRQIHRPFMPDQHREFFGQLPMVFAGTVDADGWPWASVLYGKPGFLTAPTDRRLNVSGGPIAGDPFWQNAKPGASIGFVGIELQSRRRNRLNGVVSADGSGIGVDVVQSFGNCPQYIHTRDVRMRRDPDAPFAPEKVTFDTLPDDVADLIRASDTFFVASYHDKADPRDTGGADVNHRGGRPGFVKVDGNTLTIPDFIGNFAFNTLGNFLVTPRAGLLFVNFETGDLVQLTGTAEILWEVDDDLRDLKGAERSWRFYLDHGHVLKAAAPLTWDAREPSPNAQMTGTWAEAAETRDLAAQAAAWRPFRVTKITDESSIIRSFHLEPADGRVSMPHKAGQFLTLQVTPEGHETPLVRTYTLSSAPTDPAYRVSIKRDGVVSNHLHDHLSVGDQILTRAPAGDFWLDPTETRPAVLLAAGVGVTPMMSMVRTALGTSVARRHHRRLTVLHGARSVAERAFAHELTAFQTASQGATRYVSVISQPEEGTEEGKDFHVSGRISRALLQSVLPLDDYDFYLCGPAGFMQDMYDTLTDLGVTDARIFAESFGPSTLQRQPVQDHAPQTQDIAEEAVVTFRGSQVEQGWTKGDGPLLDFAERHGLTPAFGCRNGACGSCACKLVSGKVAYVTEPSITPEDGDVLICCAVPAVSDEPLVIDL